MTESLPEFPCAQTREQALIIIQNYFEQKAFLSVNGEDEVSKHLSARFYAWLDDPCGRREKEQALDMLMEWSSKHDSQTV